MEEMALPDTVERNNTSAALKNTFEVLEHFLFSLYFYSTTIAEANIVLFTPLHLSDSFSY